MAVMGAWLLASGRQRAESLVYSPPMATAAHVLKPTGLARIFGWRRVRFVLLVCLLFGTLLNIGNQAPAIIVFLRASMMGMALLFMFGWFEQWPKTLWRPFSRWGWQLLGIVIVIPFVAAFAYWITTGGDPELGTNKLRQAGYAQLCMTALLFAPWIAVGAVIRQREAFARDQAMAFELEKSELERKGLDTRVMTAIRMEELAEPYIRRRALRHLEVGRTVIFAAGTGNPYFSTDTAAALRAIQIKADVIIKATSVDGVYSADPKQDPNAKFYEEISYRDVMLEELKVMDQTAVTLCKENSLPLIVLNIHKPGAIAAAVRGERVGTLVK